MTNVEILNTILSIPGATMARTNKTNFIVIPTEDGGYAKVHVGSAQTTGTKNHKPFNFDAAVAEFKAYEAEVALREAEKASKPAKVKGPNMEAQARRDDLDAKIAALPAFAENTATDILNALAGQVAQNVTRMAVGQSAKRLVEKGILTVEVKADKKSYYTKA